MKLEGIHHVSSITSDAQANVDFYAGMLGLRLVKKTVNQDNPTVYHLFYGDDNGSPGFDLTFFEYPGARPGRAGEGMIHRIVLRVASEEALDFWKERLGSGERSAQSLVFSDPEGLGLELRAVRTPDAPHRGGRYVYDQAPSERSIPGAGTVHHVAWAALDHQQLAWRDRVIAAGANPTPVIDRYWFRSVYFREPSGVLFEIATMGPGFTVDEDLGHLGERLVLPPKFEHLRAELDATLTPIHTPATVRR